MKIIPIFFTILCLQFWACKKNVTVIVVPEACLTANKAIVKRQDTLVFTDCSKGATSTYLYFIKDGDTKPAAYSAYSFDANKKAYVALEDTGSYKAILQASGEAGAPIKTTEMKIKVNQ